MSPQQQEAMDREVGYLMENGLAEESSSEWACPCWKVPCGDGVLGRCGHWWLVPQTGGDLCQWKIAGVSHRQVPSTVTLPNLSLGYGTLLNTTCCKKLHNLYLTVVSTLIMLSFIFESIFGKSRVTALRMIFICASVLTVAYVILKFSFRSKVDCKIKILVMNCNIRNDCQWYVRPRWERKRKKREPERERTSERELKRESKRIMCQLYIVLLMLV